MNEKDKYDEKKMFRVPDNYFEDLTSGIMQDLDGKQQNEKPGFLAIARPHLMLAASMIVLVIISYATLRFVLPEFKQNDPEGNIEELTEYLAYEIDEASLFENIDLIDIDDFASESSAALSEEDIIEYLAYQDINYESLLENL